MELIREILFSFALHCNMRSVAIISASMLFVSHLLFDSFITYTHCVFIDHNGTGLNRSEMLPTDVFSLVCITKYKASQTHMIVRTA